MIGFGQTWQYSEDGNAFDGKYKIAIIKGSGNNYPYNTPSLTSLNEDRKKTKLFS